MLPSKNLVVRKDRVRMVKERLVRVIFEGMRRP